MGDGGGAGTCADGAAEALPAALAHPAAAALMLMLMLGLGLRLSVKYDMFYNIMMSR